MKAIEKLRCLLTKDKVPFLITDRCEFCNAIQGGYVGGSIDFYVNRRNGRECSICKKDETI